jgi:hypothetical protein
MVEAATTAEETETAAPFCVTAYAVATAVVAPSASLKVRVNVTPSAANTDEVNVGGVRSVGVTETDVEATESPTLFTVFK